MVNGKYEFVAEVLADGRVTIPKSLRKLLNIVPGKFVRMQVVEVLEKRE